MILQYLFYAQELFLSLRKRAGSCGLLSAELFNTSKKPSHSGTAEDYTVWRGRGEAPHSSAKNESDSSLKKSHVTAVMAHEIFRFFAVIFRRQNKSSFIQQKFPCHSGRGKENRIVCRACSRGKPLVPVVGVEPTWYCYQRILSPSRLPIPPYRLKRLPEEAGKITILFYHKTGDLSTRKNPHYEAEMILLPRIAASATLNVFATAI